MIDIQQGKDYCQKYDDGRLPFMAVPIYLYGRPIKLLKPVSKFIDTCMENGCAQRVLDSMHHDIAVLEVLVLLENTDILKPVNEAQAILLNTVRMANRLAKRLEKERTVSRVPIIKGEFKMDILKKAVILLDGYRGHTESEYTNWLGVNLKDGSLNFVKITIVKGGIEVEDFFGVTQEKVAKQIAMLYQAKAQELEKERVQ